MSTRSIRRAAALTVAGVALAAGTAAAPAVAANDATAGAGQMRQWEANGGSGWNGADGGGTATPLTPDQLSNCQWGTSIPGVPSNAQVCSRGSVTYVCTYETYWYELWLVKHWTCKPR